MRYSDPANRHSHTTGIQFPLPKVFHQRVVQIQSPSLREFGLLIVVQMKSFQCDNIAFVLVRCLAITRLKVPKSGFRYGIGELFVPVRHICHLHRGEGLNPHFVLQRNVRNI